MKQIIAIFILLTINLLPLLAKADAMQPIVDKVEARWAHIHYNVAKEQQDAAYQQLLVELKVFQAQYPNQAELIIQQAIIVASNAENIDALSALQAVNEARDLLLQAIELDPNASAGAAYVTLGSLYYRVPGWPIAFGDDDKARVMLQKALTVNPDTIDANYFYGDFLVTQGKQQEAVTYFKRALAIPVRETQVFADTQLHAQAEIAIIENDQALAANQQIISVSFDNK